jgi:hypothetical protein
LRYAIDYDFSGGHVIYKNGRPVADIYTEIMTAGNYTFEKITYVNMHVLINDIDPYGSSVAEGTTLREFIENYLSSVLCDLYGIEDWRTCSIYKDGVRVTDLDAPAAESYYVLYTDGR